MSTFLDQGGNPLAADCADARVDGLQADILRARVRDTTVRLSLAMFQARGYAQVWGRDAEALTWEANAERIRVELAELNSRLTGLNAHRLAA
ncbi:MAG: hypothetical protein ACOH17_10100 [Cellulomonas sp.]